jgi:hypothetical protein
MAECTGPVCPVTAVPGGDCLCGRGPAIGTIAWTSGRVWFRAFHDGPVAYHHANAADWACVDCVADIAVAVASGEVREAGIAAVRSLVEERLALVRRGTDG